eukprot:6185512-Pleurochrysis_carterae.AAC.2
MVVMEGFRPGVRVLRAFKVRVYPNEKSNGSAVEISVVRLRSLSIHRASFCAVGRRLAQPRTHAW